MEGRGYIGKWGGGVREKGGTMAFPNLIVGEDG